MHIKFLQLNNSKTIQSKNADLDISKEDIQLSNMHKKDASTSLILSSGKKWQTNQTMTEHFTPPMMDLTKNINDNSIGEGVEKLNLYPLLVEN